MRSQMIKLIDRINAIEQEHLLSSMGNISGASEQAAGSIFTNAYFRKSIEAEDYSALMTANSQEKKASEYAQRYVSNYESIKKMYDRYVLARTEAEAEDKYGGKCFLHIKMLLNRGDMTACHAYRGIIPQFKRRFNRTVA